MKYTQKSFSVPASGNGICTGESGHSMADRRGFCVRCGEDASRPPEPYHPAMTVVVSPGHTHISIDGLATR